MTAFAEFRTRGRADQRPTGVSRALVLVTLGEMLTDAEDARDCPDGAARTEAVARVGAIRDAPDRLAALLNAPPTGPTG